MDAHVKQLAEIRHHIQQASVCGENGLVGLHYAEAIGLIRKLTLKLGNGILELESMGVQPEEIRRVELLSSTMELNTLLLLT